MENDIITALKDRLGAIPTTDYKSYFEDIAKILMNKCVIKKCVIKKCGVNNEIVEYEYEIVEIEFYLFTPQHQDVITYPRKLSAGQWFFHQSGVDLTFDSDDKHFGGILIRGLSNITTGELTLGPQKCVELLWDKSDAFKVNENEYPIIIVAPNNLDENFQNFPRWIPAKDEDKAKKLKYWSERVQGEGYEVSTTDKTEIVFSSRYRFIKFDLINRAEGWSGYSAKPRVEKPALSV